MSLFLTISLLQTKRAAEGSGSGDGLPITDGTTSDDEDYQNSYSSSYSSMSEYGSGGSSSYSDSESTDFTPSEGLFEIFTKKKKL